MLKEHRREFWNGSKWAYNEESGLLEKTSDDGMLDKRKKIFARSGRVHPLQKKMSWSSPNLFP